MKKVVLLAALALSAFISSCASSEIAPLSDSAEMLVSPAKATTFTMQKKFQGTIYVGKYNSTTQKFVSSGKISIPKGANLYVTLANTSLMDAPAVVLNKVTYKNVTSLPKTFSFTLNNTIEITPRTYQISAHWDVNNDGKYSKGDYILMFSQYLDGSKQSDVYLEKIAY